MEHVPRQPETEYPPPNTPSAYEYFRYMREHPEARTELMLDDMRMEMEPRSFLPEDIYEQEKREVAEKKKEYDLRGTIKTLMDRQKDVEGRMKKLESETTFQTFQRKDSEFQRSPKDVQL